MISIAVFTIGIQFIIEKLFQSKQIKNISNILLYQFFVGLFMAVLFLAINGFKVSFTWFSFIMVALYSLFSMYTVLGLVAIKYGKLSIYTMFLLIGGMLIPYLYGVFFLDEELTIYRIIGIIVILGSLIVNSLFSDNKEEVKTKKIFWVLCMIIFFLNAGISIVSKEHQININAIETNSFIFWSGSFKAFYSGIGLLIFLLFIKSKNSVEESTNLLGNTKLTIMYAFIFVIVAGISTFCLLEAAKTLPATAQYPFVSGGTTVVTAVFARVFFKEKINKIQIFALLFLFIGTILFLF